MRVRPPPPAAGFLNRNVAFVALDTLSVKSTRTAIFSLTLAVLWLFFRGCYRSGEPEVDIRAARERAFAVNQSE